MVKKQQIDKIIILDFGSQTTQLIAKKIRKKGVLAEIYPHDTAVSILEKEAPKGIIFSGGPSSLYEKKAPRPDNKVFDLNVPILGICYGLYLIVEKYGGIVTKGDKYKEYGKAELIINSLGKKNKLFQNISEKK
jgi:GMP synthase (glutamine-hydrolysing)